MSAKEAPFRMESDLLGSTAVPIEAFHGAQTQRALENFPTGNRRTIGDYPDLIRGMMVVKLAAAKVNCAGGFLSGRVADAIVASAEEVLREELYDRFPIHFLHGGGGTSANMNANEVLANMAEERLGGRRGEYQLVHPNDHVNLHQSTNDVYPTACHIAIILKWKELRGALERLAEAFSVRARELASQSRIARTCLQDAVPIGFGNFLGGYASLLKRSLRRLQRLVEDLYSVNMGGTIVGRKKDVPPSYLSAIVPAIAEELGDTGFRQAEDLYDAAQNPDPIAAVASMLSILARGLVKIGKDFRLMGSGPECGFGEILMPPVQPGSSIMPGKVNPVIAEFLIQTAFQAMGHGAACQVAVDHGELDLNVWESIMIANVLDAMSELGDGIRAFEFKCVSGFTVVVDRNTENAGTIAPMLVELMHKCGYSAASAVCREAGGDREKLGRMLREVGPLPQVPDLEEDEK